MTSGRVEARHTREEWADLIGGDVLSHPIL
jgi:hypothetical protein